MTARVDTADLSLPTGGFPGLDPSWSHRIEVDGQSWHYLDNAASLDGPPRATLLCVHGNPTWSYLWRSLVAAGSDAGYRVVAVDQLGMGFSQRDGHWRLADRVRDLGRFTDAIGLSGDDWDGVPVTTVGHDWGGVVSLGWAVDHPRELARLVLTNTAVHQPADSRVPFLLRLARQPAVHETGTVTTSTFLDVTLSLARPALAADVRDAYRAPYRGRDRRAAIGAFVEDIPVDAGHPSFAELDRIATGVRALHVPALLLWGPGDPVFSDRYLRDLIGRLPHADVHRFEGANHLVIEDADVAGTVVRWLDALEAAPRSADAGVPDGTDVPDGAAPSVDAAREYRPLTAPLTDQATSIAPAVVALGPHGTSSVSWAELATRVERLALGLADLGVRPGDRVSALVPPGVDLTTVLFACFRLGAVAVLADGGLGLAGLTRAVRGAGPAVIIGIERALVGANLGRWPGRRILVTSDAGAPAGVRNRAAATALGTETTLDRVIARGAELAAAGTALPPEPQPDDDAAILFTSGSTGPAKGVVYTHRRLAGMRDVVGETYGLSKDRPFVAGFAPFALLGTALGATSATPDMDVTSPSTLTAAALADAVAAIDADAVFASPSALANTVRTAPDLTADQRQALARVRLFLSAGAPISSAALARVHDLMPNADPHTPYGMTEVLPLTDVSLEQILEAERDAAAGTVVGAGGGTCVGRPVPGARIRVIPLDAAGRPTGEPTDRPGVTGELLVTAPNLKDRYDRLWNTEQRSRTWPGWHRTEDVGHLDADGRVWIEGRLAHIVVTERGVVTPVQLETAVSGIRAVERVAVVGVGPVGAQQVVVVLDTDPAQHRGSQRAPSLAPAGLAAAVRRVAHVPVAAVFRVPEVPTDIRHNSKVDRTRVAAWAERMLAGERAGTP